MRSARPLCCREELPTALLVVQWIAVATTTEGNYEGALTYLPLPMTLLAVQVVSRRAAVAAIRNDPQSQEAPGTE